MTWFVSSDSPFKPLVSITLPVASTADPLLLDKCLRSIEQQTYSRIEILILVSEAAPIEIGNALRVFPDATVIEASVSKSQARNLLAARATGKYLLYLDVDQEMEDGFINECVKIAEEGEFDAIFATMSESPSGAFWSRCRALEREIMVDDPGYEIPVFIRMNTFRLVGGFDRDLDVLDDWTLNLRLRKHGARITGANARILIQETTKLTEMAKRKFERGRALPELLDKYPDTELTNFGSRYFRSLARHWRVLLSGHVFTLGLAFLKTIDWLALSVGRLTASSQPMNVGTDPYFRHEIAREYESVRLGSNFNRYKHYAEVRSLINILSSPPGNILEVGCGTGRITMELKAFGWNVTPTDPSREMIIQLKAKDRHPSPILASGLHLPFASDTFDTVVSIRVIWHLPNDVAYINMFKEMTRVANKSVVFDMANEQRWQHPLARLAGALYFGALPNQKAGHQTTTLFALRKIGENASNVGYEMDKILPLDTISPLWLNLLPKAVSGQLFPILRKLDIASTKILPPGRFLISLVKQKVD